VLQLTLGHSPQVREEVKPNQPLNPGNAGVVLLQKRFTFAESLVLVGQDERERRRLFSSSLPYYDLIEV